MFRVPPPPVFPTPTLQRIQALTSKNAKLTETSMSFCSEHLQDLPTEDLLERFGSDPRPPNRPQKMFYKNGEMFIRDPEEDTSKNFPRQSSFIPGQCKGELFHSLEAWDTSALCFSCYTEEDGWEEEIHRIRSFKLYYHLADDTISLFEPQVENSGLPQGRIFRHQKAPSMNRLGGPYLHWRDLNLGIEVEIFGKRYRITSCDDFTRKFLEEHGTKLNEAEAHPEDPWTVRRRPREREKVEKEAVPRHFIPRPPQLHFRCCWLDGSNDFHGCRLKRIFKITVFTLDDTVSLTEETKEYEGQLFLRRIHLPKPMEQDGIRRHYHSWDIRPGVWIDVFSRPMFIYECCGEPTREFMTQQYGEVDFRNCTNEVLQHGPPPLTFERAPNELRFYARMLDPPVQLAGVGFLLTYNVNSKKVDIVEAGKQRKWAVGRSFLAEVDASTFSENQFAVEQIVQFFKWRFQLIEGDRETTEYLHWRGTR